MHAQWYKKTFQVLAGFMMLGLTVCGYERWDQQTHPGIDGVDHARITEMKQALAGTVFISPQSARTMCLTVAGGQNRDGAQVVLERCDGKDQAQMWRFDGASLTIFKDKCLDVTSGRDQDGTHLQIWTCHRGNTHQRWAWQHKALKWQGHSRCIDRPDGLAQPGTPLQIWSCGDDNTNQQWRLIGQPNLSSATSPDALQTTPVAQTPAAPSAPHQTTAPVSAAPTASPQSVCKRGMAIGNEVHPALSARDLAAVAGKVAWWFISSEKALSQEIAEASRKTGVSFVPMIFRGGSTAQSTLSELDSHSGYLLAFNEPNFTSQANMTPQQAAQAWPAVEEVARRYNLKIVGPAMNYCGGGCNQTDPFAWLDQFFAACQGCQVDYLAVHAYVCYPSALTGAYLTPFARYKKKLWVTEFSCLDGSANADSLENQKRYMKESVAMMEADDQIFRYAWFIGRSNSATPPLALLGADGQLTELGRVYVSLPRHCDIKQAH